MSTRSGGGSPGPGETPLSRTRGPGRHAPTAVRLLLPAACAIRRTLYTTYAFIFILQTSCSPAETMRAHAPAVHPPQSRTTPKSTCWLARRCRPTRACTAPTPAAVRHASRRTGRCRRRTRASSTALRTMGRRAPGTSGTITTSTPGSRAKGRRRRGPGTRSMPYCTTIDVGRVGER